MNHSEALERLREGNARYAAGEGRARPAWSNASPSEQRPFAIILGCSDSRVPAEAVFDAGIGELFVVRVAGNVVTPAGIGSIEFAAQQFGTRLVVVLGHSHCGAVNATLNATPEAKKELSPNLASVIDCIEPALAPLQAAGDEVSLEDAVSANARAGAEALRAAPVLAGIDGLRVVAAEYSLVNGEVSWLD